MINKKIFFILILLVVSLTFLIFYSNKKRIEKKEQKILRIGVLGVMSGQSKAWGMICKNCALVTAQMYNEKGGIIVGRERYLIKITSFDTQLNPKKAIEGAEKLVKQEGIRYIIGPNVYDTTHSTAPILQGAGAINISYGFTKSSFSPPQKNNILGMVASWQTVPFICSYLQNQRNIKTISFIARNDREAINQRNLGIATAKKLGLKTLDIDTFDINKASYKSKGKNLKTLLKKYVDLKPDAIMLSGAAPADTPILIKNLRQLGYKGFLATATAQDIKLVNQAGAFANGLISVGGTLPIKKYSPYMKNFIKIYKKMFGHWNDEAGTKAYALETILRTIQKAGKKAITDTDFFIKAMDTFTAQDPFWNSPREIKYVGKKVFKQKRQINVPIIITEVKNGHFQPIFIKSLPE